MDPPSQLRGAPWGTVEALKRLTAAAVVAAELVPSIAPTTTECWTDIVMASKHSCGHRVSGCEPFWCLHLASKLLDRTVPVLNHC
jgi:hypothetical protein